MPLSGLVITWDGPLDAHAASLAELRRHPAIEVGQLGDFQCAIVVDTTDPAEDRQVWDWLQALPGVAQVQIAFVGFDEQIDEA